MKHKNILLLGAALLLAIPTFSAPADNNDKGTKQTLTVNHETINGTVSEIRLDGNNAVLTFTDGTTLTADMRLVTLTMSYDEATGVEGVKEVREVKGVKDNSWYTLDGIKVTLTPKKKGVYIVNGKKVVNNK